MKTLSERLVGCGLVAALAGWSASGASGVSITFQQDTPNSFYPSGYTLTGDNQILGYGGFENANVGARNSMQLGTGDPPHPRRAILRFDGLNVMAGQYASISSAQIVLRKTNAPDFQYAQRVDTQMWQISDANASWVEGNGIFAPAATGESAWNFRSRPDGWAGSPGLSTPGVDTGATPLATVNMGAEDAVNSTYSFSLSPSLVEQWINGINGGVMFRFADESIANAVELYTSEFGTVDDAPVRPKLVIEYTVVSGSRWNVDADGNWSDAANWQGGVPNSPGAAANFADAIKAARTVTADLPITVGAITFDNANSYTIAGTSTLTLDVASGSASISVVSGSHTISAPLALADNTDISVAARQTLSVSHARGQGLNITSGNVKVLPKASANDPAGTSVVTSLSIAAGATLDLTNNSAVIDYTGAVGTLVDDVRQHLSSARLISSSADADTGLGYADNANLGRSTFAGQTIDSSSLLIKYTYLGDTNLDGQVDVIDLGNLATAWQTNAPWAGGDSNYDGFVDVIDLGLLATNWQANVGGPGLAEAMAQFGLPAALAPEPAGSGLALLAWAPFAARRARRRVAGASPEPWRH